MTIEDTEKRAAEVSTAPRIALADIEAEITHKYFMTGAQFMSHAYIADHVVKGNLHTMEAGATTLCMVMLKNGWLVIGKSAPVSTANYNADLGRKIAYEDCVRQIWPLLGYQLKEHLHSTQ